MLTYLLTFLTRLKMISKLFILAEALDVFTTLWGILFIPQIWEANPIAGFLGSWPATLAVKVLATLIVVWVLEKIDSWPDLVRIIPILASLPVLWNILAILLEAVV